MFAFDSDSKFFLFFCCLLELLFTFDYFFPFLFRTAFYYISFLLLMSYSLCLLEPAIHRICHHLLEGLFSFCAVVPIFITLFWGCTRFSRHVLRLYILFTFSIFLKWILILLVREKHRKTLYRFLFNKNKEWGKNNRDKNSETRQTDNK